MTHIHTHTHTQTYTHTPNILTHIQDEKKRIKDLGGLVLYKGVWRVNGILAVSRAIGQYCYECK